MNKTIERWFLAFALFALAMCVLLVVSLAANGQSYTIDQPPLKPDAKLTPGTVTNVPIEVLTAHGYTASPGIRHVAESTKRQVFILYFGKVPDNPGRFEIDHLISLELGGSNSISNLWPQAYESTPWNSRMKDKLENKLASLVRLELKQNGSAAANLMLARFQQGIATNWTQLYLTYCK